MTAAKLAKMEALCFPNASVTWSEQDYATHLAARQSLTVCDETGFVIGQTASDEAEIISMGVLPDQRRLGHGTDLLASFEREARAKGAVWIFLEVSVENEAAIALYNAHGFRKVGRRRKYYENAKGIAIDAHIFKKAL